jgi:hypothetical protein
MVLKGGSLKFSAGNTPEDVILAILQARDTEIILLSENHKYKGVSAFILQITVAERFKDAFDRSGLPLYSKQSNKTVIILKFFVYNDDPKSALKVNNEVSTQERLDAQTSSQQICPSVLYCKDIEEVTVEGTIDKALYDLLQHPDCKAVLKNNEVSTTVTYKRYNETMYNYISMMTEAWFSVAFNSLKKKAFFMEFFSCKSLLEFCKIPQYFAEGQPVTSIDGIQLKIGHTPNTQNYVLGLDTDSFITMALHYVTLKLFKFNCIHGDLHASNVYVLLDGTNIVFLVIDLGDGNISSPKLRLRVTTIDGIIVQDTPSDLQDNNSLIIEKLKANNVLREESEYNTRYFEKLNDYQKNKLKMLAKLYATLIEFKARNVSIFDHISYQIEGMKLYFEAAVMINMCIEYKSPFTSTFKSHVDVKEQYAYTPLYCSYKDETTLQIFNQIIEQCLYPRTETEIPPKIAKTNGGSFIYKNRINKFIASKQINNKSKKSKKRKNKTINRKKSRKITRKKLQNRRQK